MRSARVAAVLAAVLVAAPAQAQRVMPTLAPDRLEDVTEVMVLGVFHFANPGADVAQFRGIDVLSPARQREIEEVVSRLETFRPTRIAVEHTPQSADSLDARLRRYRAGSFTLPTDETYQLGFRLASRMGHERVYPIDYRKPMRIDSVMAYRPETAQRFQAYIGQVVALMDALQREETIGANLRFLNEPAVIETGHQAYTEMAAVGGGDGYIGARVVTDWYDRNLHMFANLARIARPGDRVVVIVGQGHAYLLRDLVRTHPRMKLVEANDYLP